MTENEKILHELEQLYGWFYKEKDDMERSVNYEKICEQIPDVKKLWEAYKEAKSDATILFEFCFERLMERYK